MMWLKSSLCPRTASASQTCPPYTRRRPSEVSPTFFLSLFLVCAEANGKHQMDKDIATEIQLMIAAEPNLGDEQAGWHVIVGKSFAASVTYNTKFVIFFDLMNDNPKSFMLFKTV